jgi:hypothetical protein
MVNMGPRDTAFMNFRNQSTYLMERKAYTHVLCRVLSNSYSAWVIAKTEARTSTKASGPQIMVRTGTIQQDPFGFPNSRLVFLSMHTHLLQKFRFKMCFPCSYGDWFFLYLKSEKAQTLFMNDCHAEGNRFFVYISCITRIRNKRGTAT